MARKNSDAYLESLLAAQKGADAEPDRRSVLAAATAEDDTPAHPSPAVPVPAEAPVVVVDAVLTAAPVAATAAPVAATAAPVAATAAPVAGEEVLFTDDKKDEDLPPEEETEEDKEALKAIKSEGVTFSIRLKLALSITILLVSAMLGLWISMLSSSTKNLMEQMEYRASIIGRNLAANLKESFEDAMARHPIVAETKKEVVDLVGVTVYDASFNLVDSSDDAVYQDVSLRIAEEKPLEQADAEDRRILAGLTGQMAPSTKDAVRIYQPVLNFQGTAQGFVILDFTKKNILDRIAEIKKRSILIIGLSIGLALSAFFLLITLMLAPIKRLIYGVRKIGAGDMRYTIRLKTGDEMELLGTEFNQMTKKLVKAQREIVEKGKLQEQINIAEDLQKNLLPDHVPDLPFFSFDSYYQAARGVGGDYYDILELSDDDMVGVIIADVSGKGVPAAIIMVIIRTIFQSIAKFVNSPEKALDMINKNISGRTSGEKYATMFYYMYNYRTGELVYSNAGHTPLMVYHRRANEISEYDAPGAPVGVLEESVYSTSSLKLEEGDIVILSTDGVTEAGTAKLGFYTEQDLKKGIIKYANLTAKEIVGNIITDINNFVGTTPQHDDMTLLILKVNKLAPAAWHAAKPQAARPTAVAQSPLSRPVPAAVAEPVVLEAEPEPVMEQRVPFTPPSPVDGTEPDIFTGESAAAEVPEPLPVEAGESGPEASEEVDLQEAFSRPAPAPAPVQPAADGTQTAKDGRSVASLKARLRLLYRHPTDHYNSLI